jgi:hypothetical protein
MPEDMEKGIREIPRDVEVIDLLRKLFGRDSVSRATTANAEHLRMLRVIEVKVS